MDTIWRNWSWIVATLATVNSLPSRFGLEKPSQTCLVTCILAPFCLVDIFDQALPLPFSICASLLLGSFTKSALLDPSFGFKNQTEGILVKVCPRGTTIWPRGAMQSQQKTQGPDQPLFFVTTPQLQTTYGKVKFRKTESCIDFMLAAWLPECFGIPIISIISHNFPSFPNCSAVFAHSEPPISFSVHGRLDALQSEHSRRSIGVHWYWVHHIKHGTLVNNVLKTPLYTFVYKCI